MYRKIIIQEPTLKNNKEIRERKITEDEKTKKKYPESENIYKKREQREAALKNNKKEIRQRKMAKNERTNSTIKYYIKTKHTDENLYWKMAIEGINFEK